MQKIFRPQVTAPLFVSLVIFALILANLGPLASMAAPSAPQSMPGGPPVTLYAGQADTQFSVPAPTTYSAQSIQSATILINYIPAGTMNELNDSCLTWPAGSQTAFNYAASIWSSLITSTVPIVINACWANLGGGGILGHAGSTASYRNFANAPVSNTWYPVALASALAGTDLDTGHADMEIAYNSTGVNWYFGTDGHPGAYQYDFVSVVLHEMTHGLGFSGSMTVSSITGLGSWGAGSGYPFTYDRFAVNGSSQGLINTGLFLNPSASLASELKSQNIFFNGTNAMAQNGGQPVKLYAPATWQQGSSYAHLDAATFDGTVNALMTWSIANGESVHDPGPITRAILKDVGWPAVSSAPVPTPAPNRSYLPIAVRSNPASVGPTAGFWSSNAGEEFYVSPDGKSILRFAIYVSAGSCGNYKITHTLPEPIASNQFSFSGGLYASGTFGTSTSASGTDGVSSITISNCGTFNGGPWTWTATWQNSTQPAALSAESQDQLAEPLSTVPGRDVQRLLNAAKSVIP